MFLIFKLFFVDNKTWPFACFPKFSFPLHLSHRKYLVWLNPLTEQSEALASELSPPKMSLLVVECVSGIGSGKATGACSLTFPVFVFISLCLRGCGSWSSGARGWMNAECLINLSFKGSATLSLV